MDAMKIPAIRGKIGNTVYYSTTMTFNQISTMVKRVDGELHTAKSLKEEIQRSLTNNYIKIKEYILNREDRFFDSLVLAVYDGDPIWTEVRFDIENNTYQNVGLLEFSGREKIFPVDGQHRVEGIKEALKENNELGNETVCVMLIGHQNTNEGREKSRRIFSTLNRYVKPVRLGDIIALDEDDIVAIVTRDMLESYPLFMGERIIVSNTKSIPRSNKYAFTTLMTLYDCNKVLLYLYKSSNGVTIKKKDIEDYLKNRPEDKEIEDYKLFLVNFWDSLKTVFTEIDDYLNNKTKNPAEKLRSNENGGNIFFRPAGLLPFIEAIVQISCDNKIPYIEIINKLSSIDRCVSSDIWNHILWDSIKHEMVMKNQILQKLIIRYLFNPNIMTDKEKKDMVKRYASLLNMDESSAFEKISSFTL